MNRNEAKYKKYKRKYINLKRIATDEINDIQNIPIKEPIDNNTSTRYENKSVDWYLFFDLLQVSKDIINMTNTRNIIILIGDTPSYLEPLLKPHRRVFHLAFSNKPFGCFLPPHGECGSTSGDVSINNIPSFNDINYDVLTAYFTYLDNSTELSRDFMKKNWDKIILVDSSTGTSIHGASIFFNRYVGNIVEKSITSNATCSYITGSKPLQFIRLTSHPNKTLNINPEQLKQLFEPNTFDGDNYRPDLIIYIGSSIFLHQNLFMINDEYPRIVPFYSPLQWDKHPNKVKNNSYQPAVKNLNKLTQMLNFYSEITKKKFDESDKWNNLFNTINLDVLRDKYHYYFDTCK